MLFSVSGNTLSLDKQGHADRFAGSSMEPWSGALLDAAAAQSNVLKHGHLPQWHSAFDAIPKTTPAQWHVVDGTVHLALPDDTDTGALKDALMALRPWRKGPFAFGDITIDTEWHSDWKWDRLADVIQPLAGRNVLDVGCGSGYHLWRMREAGATLALGIDPSLLFFMQHQMIQHFAEEPSLHFLPMTMDTLPADMQAFDTVFSMGVLYHRRDPMEHLMQLHSALHPDGELVLETLIIGDDGDTGLLAPERYANMRNVWEVPSRDRLIRWVAEAGFSDPRLVSVAQTECEEQRTTEWMPAHSLAQALDPVDKRLTIEGHPRPLRAIVLATRL